MCLLTFWRIINLPRTSLPSSKLLASRLHWFSTNPGGSTTIAIDLILFWLDSWRCLMAWQFLQIWAGSPHWWQIICPVKLLLHAGCRTVQCGPHYNGNTSDWQLSLAYPLTGCLAHWPLSLTPCPNTLSLLRLLSLRMLLLISTIRQNDRSAGLRESPMPPKKHPWC